MSSTPLEYPAAYGGRVEAARPTTDEVGERIVAAALACFEEVGIRRTSMEDIARAAGVGRMTVFRRFESKDRLVQVVLIAVVGGATERVRSAFFAESELEAGITEALMVAVRTLRDHPLFVKVVRTEPEAFLRTLTVDGASVIAVVRRSVADWLGASGGGPLHDEDAEMVAETVTRLGMSLILSPGGPIPLEEDEGMRGYIGRYIAPGVALLAAE